jgi:hypothetical protein
MTNPRDGGPALRPAPFYRRDREGYLAIRGGPQDQIDDYCRRWDGLMDRIEGLGQLFIG